MDLRNIRKTFDELVLSRLSDKILKVNNIHKDKELITEESMYNKQIIEVPFGSIIYSLGIEDEKPVLYLEKASRMGSDDLYIIDENSYEHYDIYDGYPPEIKERYFRHLEKIMESESKIEKGGI